MASYEYVPSGRLINPISAATISSLPSSKVVSSEEFHTSHRHHPELSGRRLSDAQPPFGPLQKRSTAPTHLWDHLQGRFTPAGLDQTQSLRWG